MKKKIYASAAVLSTISAIFIIFSFSYHRFESDVIQVGVVVSDLDKSISFYKEIIGMKETGGFSISTEFGKSSGLSNGSPFDVRVLQLSDSENATQWKLMSFGGKPEHKPSRFIQDDLGMQYITINVKTLAPLIKKIRENGIQFLGETPVELKNGNHFVLIQDPDGIFIELIGPLE